ncbi:MAG: YfcE family phosphodiesterase [Candidatus Lokiarchaeota archaeon]|nr:YfcE family phosphodiesterase [Candidatus Lokiarchaeota archaeon]
MIIVKIGLISDTHIDSLEKKEINELLNELQQIFKDVDTIIHAGDINNEYLLKELIKIAPTIYVSGDDDKLEKKKDYNEIKVDQYTIGITHKLPENLEAFCKKKNLIGGILVFGHTHKPLIKGTVFNTLLLNPGSPTKPKAPDQIKGFDNPIARPSVMILNIERGIVSSFIINLKFHSK